MTFDSTTLEALLERVVSKAVAAVANLGSHRLAYTEPEAAALLGVKPHVLGDARRMGMIRHTKVGGRISYTRKHLDDYLEAQAV